MRYLLRVCSAAAVTLSSQPSLAQSAYIFAHNWGGRMETGFGTGDHHTVSMVVTETNGTEAQMRNTDTGGWSNCNGDPCLRLATADDLGNAVGGLQQQFSNLSTQVQAAFAAPAGAGGGQLTMQQQLDTMRSEIAGLRADVEQLKERGLAPQQKR